MMWRAVIHAFIILACAFLLTACDQDPFHQSKRKLAGDYYLQRWEDGKTYYIHARNGSEKSDQGGGVINGTVEKIGWSTDYVIVKRRSTFQGDQNGWMVLRVKGASMAGPYTDEDIAKFPEAVGMHFFDPEAAWESLR